MIEKRRTAKLIAPRSVAAAFEHPDWPGYELGRIVRHALASTISPELRSSGFRGGDTLGIGTFLSSGDSSVWVENPTSGQWQITLGLQAVGGRAGDWTMLVTLDETDGQPGVRVAVSEYLAKDGALVHAAEFSLLRDRILEGAAAGTAPPVDAEVDLGDRGFPVGALPALTEIPPLPYSANVCICSSATLDAVRGDLELTALPRTAVEPGCWRWSLGLSGDSTITATLSSEGEHTRLDLSADLEAGRTVAESAVTVLQARILVQQLRLLMTSDDPDIEVTGDETLLAGVRL